MSNEPLRVFLDTDIGPDCDDTAALAILLQLCREGRAQLLGATHCTGSPYGLAAIDAICRLFGTQVPLGTCANRAFLSDGPALRYTPSIASAFPHGYPVNAPQPDAVDALTRALSGAPEDSVVFIAIGPLNNVARYLTDPVAAPLMHSRVARMVLMAGAFEGDFTEWNVEMDVPAMQTVAARWHKPIDLCPFEALSDVLTGAPLARRPDNPVTVAYRLFTEGGMLRPSWDLGAVACAVLGPQPPFEWSAPGALTVDERGRTRLAPCPEGTCRFLRRVGSAQDAVEWLDGLLARAVETMTQALI